MGYTPAFDDIYMGTLYGRWPAAAVWASLLPLIDANGCIDMSLQAICGMTGWPMDLLKQGIEQLMEPDPDSRSPDSEGRRLVPMEPGRPWGWRAVNHRKYRERARLQNKNAREVESGQNQERMATKPPLTAAHRRSPPLTPSHTHTQTQDKTPLPPKGGDERFEEFWRAYPRRVGKAAAKRVWSRKGLNAKTAEIVAHLAERVRSDAQWLRDGGQFVPYPGTWLNRDGWLDEYERAAPKGAEIDDGAYV